MYETLTITINTATYDSKYGTVSYDFLFVVCDYSTIALTQQERIWQEWNYWKSTALLSVEESEIWNWVTFTMGSVTNSQVCHTGLSFQLYADSALT